MEHEGVETCDENLEVISYITEEDAYKLRMLYLRAGIAVGVIVGMIACSLLTYYL